MVTLVLLAVMIIIGTAGMGTTILQERMASNVQDSAQVFEAAESALRICGQRVVAGNSGAAGEATAVETATFEQGGTLGTLAAAELRVPTLPDPGHHLTAKGDTRYQLRCLIEFTGPVDAARTGGSLRRPSTTGNLLGYRITAAGVRVASDAVTMPQRPTVLLQSDLVVRQ